jgi:long-chain acyl-CoA synthetase
VAYADEDGYLFLVDRTKDLIIVSGFNVFPKEVEEALVRLPGVADAAVIGVPDQRTGEAVKALVVLEPGADATPHSLIDDVGRYLARFKIPREVEIVHELPRNPTGKVLRRALRGEILGGGETPS